MSRVDVDPAVGYVIKCVGELNPEALLDDLLGTTRLRQGQQQECPSGEGPRRGKKCPSKEPSKSTVGEY